MGRYLVVLVVAVCALVTGCGGNKDSLMRKAYFQARKGNWQKAQELVMRYLEAVPTDREAGILLSLCLMKEPALGQDGRDRALKLTQRIAAVETGRYDVQLVYGWLLYSGRNYSEAYGPLKLAYDLHLQHEKVVPQESQGTVKYLLGRCCMQLGKYDEAMTYLAQAIASTPYSHWSSLYSDLGTCAFLSGHLGKAYDYLKAGTAMAREEALVSEAAKKSQQSGGDSRQHSDQDRDVNPNVYALYVNLAVLCDFLTYPKYGKEKPGMTWPIAQQCYGIAEFYVGKKLEEEQNPKHRDYYKNLLTRLQARRVSAR